MRTKQAIATVCAVALSLFASSALAHQAQPNLVAKEKQAGQKKICRDLETTGTRFKDRVCLTKEEWKEVEKLR